MSNRIKVGDVYLELPAGASTRPNRVVAEKTDTPAMLEPVAFTTSEPDLIAQYMVRADAMTEVDRQHKPAEAPLDRMAEWLAFTGAKSKIPEEWALFADGKQRHCGFNIWAFVFGMQWFLFNKMFGYAAICAAVEALTVFAAVSIAMHAEGLSNTSQLGSPLALLIVSVGCAVPRLAIGFWANHARYHQANLEIQKVRTFNVDNQRKLAMIASAGAGSAALLVGFYLLTFLSKFLSMD